MVPKTSQIVPRPLQDGPSRLQDGLETAQDGLCWYRDRPRIPHDCPKTAQGSPKWPPRHCTRLPLYRVPAAAPEVPPSPYPSRAAQCAPALQDPPPSGAWGEPPRWSETDSLPRLYSIVLSDSPPPFSFRGDLAKGNLNFDLRLLPQDGRSRSPFLPQR